ncbi:MAG: ABC transporter substrate-binding protein [Candidatus Izemoplasmatales bacterium]|jgi:peptide/nickel transport system substrate-binding protein|nr:ABC transporter substrate-binding protein [Candidatus Izemoplasmatales bacterium]
MKKLLLTAFVMFFAVVLVACGGTTTQAPTTAAPTTAAPTTAAPTTAAPTTAAPTTVPTTEAPTTLPPVPIYETVVTNDTYTLLLQSSTMDGIFSPYFYSSAYDGDVVGLVNVGLLSMDQTGAVVASDYYPSVANGYSIYYTDNSTTLAPKEEFVDGDFVVYEMVIKNGAKFSDGTVIDADDVLYNYYVYLDPAYSGSSTLYTLPILGLGDYRTQVIDSASLAPLADAILAADERVSGYTITEAYTEAQHDAYWAAMNLAGSQFAGEIVSYVLANYATDSFVARYFGGNFLVEDAAGLYVKTSATAIATYDATNAAHEGLTRYNCTLTFADVKASAGLSVAYGMAMWGFYGSAGRAYSLSADGLTWSGVMDDYDIATLSNADYFNDILGAYTEEDGSVDYQNVSDVESAASDLVARAKELFISSYAETGSVPNIAGLRKGTKTIDGETFETVIVILTEQNPKAILSLGVTVAPQHYYLAGYSPTAGAVVNYGVEWNNPLFMAHLETFNGAPMGAGSHKFVGVDAGDGTVYFERNDNFYTMGGTNVYNSNIDKIAMKVVTGGAEYSALEAGDVHYATVSATADVMEDVALDEDLIAILVDNLGYGYILVNPQVYSNINFRIALTTVFDLTKVLDYYPNGLADIIYRSQSQVSWAYPENAQAIYPFDETLEDAIAYFTAAGMTFTEGVVTDFGGNKGSVEDPILFTLPSDASAHPAGGVFIRAQELLATIGITAQIINDANLIANIKLSPVGVYALAWQSSADPDLYQVYHYMSQAESVISNGIVWLHANGNNDELGTIEVVKLDGTTVTMNQHEALVYLAELIEEGVKYMLPEERKPVYDVALTILAQLNIEIPTYQRKNLFVYDGRVIDQTTLSTTVTPYWGPLAEIWKVSFAEGIPGNVETEIIVGYED